MQLGFWGYPNGRIPYDKMVQVEGQWFHPEVAKRIAWAIKETRRQGGRVTISEGYRNYDDQIYWRNYWCNRGACGNGAVPGTSNHGWGMAADVSSPDSRSEAIRKAVFRQAGLLFTISNESWHCDASGEPTVFIPEIGSSAADVGSRTPIPEIPSFQQTYLYSMELLT